MFGVSETDLPVTEIRKPGMFVPRTGFEML